MKLKQKKESRRFLQYAQQHTLMLLLLLLFFGVIVVPRFYDQILQSRFKKTDGKVTTIYYSQATPVLSFIEITYNVKGKTYTTKELINQSISVGDHLEIFVGEKDNSSVQLKKPSFLPALVLLLAYVLILLFCLYRAYQFLF